MPFGRIIGIGELSLIFTLLFLQKTELITFPSAPPSIKILAGRPLTAPTKVSNRRAFLCLLSFAVNDWRWIGRVRW